MMLCPLTAEYWVTQDVYLEKDCPKDAVVDTPHPSKVKKDECKVGECVNSGFKNSLKTTACEKVATSKAGGEPHFRMWNGVWFDYMGECDLVLLQCPNFASGTGLLIHARTEIRYRYSFIRNLALRIGDEVFEIAGREEYYLNGIARSNCPSKFAGFSLKRMNETMRCGKTGECAKVTAYSIDFKEYGKAILSMWRDFIYISISGNNLAFEGAVGLMGSWGKPGKFARDNTTILDDDNAFGQEWQVLKSEPMIFHEIRAPQHPQQCNRPKVRKRLSENAEVRRLAQNACSRLSGKEFEMCTRDVMLTGDINMAFIPNFF